MNSTNMATMLQSAKVSILDNNPDLMWSILTSRRLVHTYYTSSQRQTFLFQKTIMEFRYYFDWVNNLGMKLHNFGHARVEIRCGFYLKRLCVCVLQMGKKLVPWWRVIHLATSNKALIIIVAALANVRACHCVPSFLYVWIHTYSQTLWTWTLSSRRPHPFMYRCNTLCERFLATISYFYINASGYAFSLLKLLEPHRTQEREPPSFERKAITGWLSSREFIRESVYLNKKAFALIFGLAEFIFLIEWMTTGKYPAFAHHLGIIQNCQ